MAFPQASTLVAFRQARKMSKIVPNIPSTWLSWRYFRDEFLEYQLQDDAEMPKGLQVHKFWNFMKRKKIWWTNFQQLWAHERIFSNLAALMKSLLCISHSNASSERSFSMMRKIITESRNSLHIDTVSALTSCKLNCAYSAAGFKPSKVELNAAKKPHTNIIKLTRVKVRPSSTVEANV